MAEKIRLTEFAHGGGCGCKLSPSVLREVLSGVQQVGPFASLLVGTETGDDAAVWRIDERTALVATTDFFNPIVDDARDFGRIAATNALSDVYAMGGRPILALALLGFPRERLPLAVASAIVAGGAEACGAAGVPVAGGHSIDNPEPIYGLAAIGLVAPDRVLTNRGARAGDALLLTKPLGVGIYGAALRKGALDAGRYERMIASTTRLNDWGATLGTNAAIHAVTDVTGFGLLGHALELCRGAGLGLEIEAAAVPLLDGIPDLAARGFVTGASGRNWASDGEAIEMASEPLCRSVLTDPQTSGGLLVAVAPEAAPSVLAAARAHGHEAAAVIGRFSEGRPAIRVRGRIAAFAPGAGA